MKVPLNLARFLPLAERLLKRGRLPALLLTVGEKLRRRTPGQLREDVRTVQQLCLAYWRGEYRQVNRKSLLIMVAGLMYFVSPLDAIPDFIPVLGFLDDVAVLSWILKTLSDELEAFRAWRTRQLPEVLAKVERLPDPDEVIVLPDENARGREGGTNL